MGGSKPPKSARHAKTIFTTPIHSDLGRFLKFGKARFARFFALISCGGGTPLSAQAENP